MNLTVVVISTSQGHFSCTSPSSSYSLPPPSQNCYHNSLVILKALLSGNNQQRDYQTEYKLFQRVRIAKHTNWNHVCLKLNSSNMTACEQIKVNRFCPVGQIHLNLSLICPGRTKGDFVLSADRPY